MKLFDRRRMIALMISAVSVAGMPARAANLVAKHTSSGVAIRGYDTTAYFQQNDALRGTDLHSVKWRGATWLFANADDAAMFAAKPEAYAPQFGGYCTRAMSFRKLVPADPKVWRIYKSKLYMFARPVGGTFFDKGQAAMIKKAAAYWDTL